MLGWSAAADAHVPVSGGGAQHLKSHLHHILQRALTHINRLPLPFYILVTIQDFIDCQNPWSVFFIIKGQKMMRKAL